MLELLSHREKNDKKETRLIALLQFVHSTVWRALFGKPGDGLERSKQSADECKRARIRRRVCFGIHCAGWQTTFSTTTL